MNQRGDTVNVLPGGSIEIHELHNGRLIRVIASGTLTRESYACFTPRIDSLAKRYGNVRLLFEMVQFEGWTIGAAWDDIKFGCARLHEIERIAIVGDRTWEKAMVAVCQPFIRARIRYFDIEDLNDANDWIQEGL